MIVIDPELMQREVLFVAATVLALGLFMAFGKRGGARTRVGDSALRRASGEQHTPLRDMYAYSDDWAGQTQVACPLGFEGPVAPACVVWEITLFGARTLEDMQSVSLAGGRYFEIGRDARESARILAPFVRKLVSRFRVDYEHARPVVVMGQTPQGDELDGSEALVSWLSSERHIHHMCNWFLKEMVAVAREARVTPSLEISWSEGLVFSVHMPFAHELSALSQLSGNECVSVAITREEVIVELWIAFPQGSVPTELFRPDRFLVSNRDKRSAS